MTEVSADRQESTGSRLQRLALEWLVGGVGDVGALTLFLCWLKKMYYILWLL